MKRSEIKVLLVEDDQNLGKALKEGLTRAGLSTKWCTSPDDALSQFKLTEYHAVIMDCVLPKKNGVELATEMRSSSSHPFKLILTSGIFKDKSFTSDAIKRAEAIEFLTKPFDLDQLKEVLENAFDGELEADKEPLAEMFARETPSLKDLKEILLANSTRHGFELPYIYSILNHAQFTGHLNLIPVDHEPSQVSFYRGEIADVKLKDVDSYFGVLLVEMGFTSPEEVEESLSQGGLPLGQLLVDASAVSPHAVNIVRSEQLAIRLSKTIQNTSVEVSLIEENFEHQGISLSAQQFSTALHDWVSSKIRTDWLSNFYTQWLENPLQVTAKLDRVTRVKDYPLLSTRADTLAQINGKNSLQSLIDRQPDAEAELLQAIHYGILEHIFYFVPKAKSAKDFRSLTQKLNRMAAGMETKNHFEILGVPVNARAKEISKAYLDFAKAFHPDKVDARAPAAYRLLCKQVFTRMTVAYEVLKDEEKREAYLRELASGSASEAFEVENTLDRARRMLTLGHYRQAEAALKPYLDGKFNLGEVRIHYLWAQVKCFAGAANTNELKAMQRLLTQVPPEDRHSAVYFYVKGLLYLASQDKDRAYQLFCNAVATDPAFADARREMLIMKKQMSTKTGWSLGKLFGADKSKKGRAA